jgi:hypothetical protein|tara:strand:+ start:228 stop:647 length:420 start_codon:yes stop_codon:yes gene_type:complete
MATNYKITYKNHCTPQEYVTENGRWYLDSDVGARLTGGANAEITSETQPVYVASTTLSTSPVSIGATTQDFVFIKNLGSTENNILISLDGNAGQYRIVLAPGESFASEITALEGSQAQNNDIYMATESGTQTVQTLRAT